MAVLLAPRLIHNEYHLHILIMIFLNVIIASSMRTIMTTGLVSFAHAAFVAIGGYASALAMMKLGLSFWVGLILAVLVVSVITCSFGLILLRLKGTYFFIASTALGEIILLIFTRFITPFGGAAGITDIPSPTPIAIPGFFAIEFSSKISFYYLTFLLMLVLMFITYRLEKGRLGAIWGGIQQADKLAQAVGINIMLYKVIAFSVGSSMAALAGSIQTHYYHQINPAGFGFFVLVNYLIFVMVGGKDKFIGPLIGATLLTLVSEILGLYESLALYQAIVYGFMLIIVVLFFPEGLVSLSRTWSAWTKARKT